ncbi:sulfatase [Leptospira gomenensis]|uniref:Sulfatase n=2 Tax=Leptospira gomenensis TaxID=2484974 RepID=A0A5F1YAA9_9LEPT|nr:sulfatase [Leptospira gomenensis]TGK34809.1 sulfatase [Leptospira gomenensis]TGK41700.1 sulfatase [Leptospira gomenensis]TGK61507.1 sulfatase [Leptospira gomenensis]
MGVDLSEFKALFLSFAPLFLKDYCKTALSSGAVFGAIGLLISVGFEHDVGSFWKTSRRNSAVATKSSRLEKTENQGIVTSNSFSKQTIVFVSFVFLIWCHSVLTYPQMYGEFFFDRVSFLRLFLFFLTDHVTPIVPQTASFLILAGCLCSAFRIYSRERDAASAIRLALFCVSLWFFHRLGNVPGIFSVSWIYIISVIFKKYKLIPLFWLVPAFWFLFFSPKFSSVNVSSVGTPAEGLPNILILSADSLRADQMGFAVGRSDITPNIDLLAKDSAIYRDHHTTIPRTFPAWADLLTGKPSFIHGIQDMFPDAEDRSGLNREFAKTLPEILRRLGYRTEAVSSFAGDIFSRADWGFETVKAPNFHAGTLTAQRILESQIFLLPFYTGSIPGGGEYDVSLRGLPSLGDDSRILPDLWNSIEGDGRPFFVVFFSSVTHFPFSPPYPFYKKFTNPEYYGKYKYYKFVDPSDSSPANVEDREQIRGLFRASISSFDDSVGKIVRRLKENGLYDSTLIVLTSDHGESLFESDHGHGHGEHLRGEGVTHVPLLIKFPGGKAAGFEFSGITSSLDLFPTLLSEVLEKNPDHPKNEILRKEIEDRKGRNLNRVFRSKSWTDDRTVYSETGIWFSDRGNHFFQKERIFYPNIIGLHSIESGEFPFISVSDPYAKESVVVSKHRSLQNGRKKLIYIPSENGVLWNCYDRIADPWNERVLAVSECASLKDSLRSFLLDSGKFRKAGEYLFPLRN